MYNFRESIKNQILAELLAQDSASQKNIIPPEIYGRLVEETRSQLMQEMGKIGGNLFHKQEPTGYLEEVIKTLDTKTRSKIQSWLNVIGNGQSKGFLYGVGTAVLLSILFPGNGRKVQSMAYRTANEGMDLIEKARSMVAKVKEEIEDIVAEASFNSLQKDIDSEPQVDSKYFSKNNLDKRFH